MGGNRGRTIREHKEMTHGQSQRVQVQVWEAEMAQEDVVGENEDNRT